MRTLILFIVIIYFILKKKFYLNIKITALEVILKKEKDLLYRQMIAQLSTPSEKQEIVHIDGSSSIRNAPMSEVISTRLKLNKTNYELGDTIIGELKVVSVQYKGRRKTKVKEDI